MKWISIYYTGYCDCLFPGIGCKALVFADLHAGEELWRYSNMNRLKRQTLAAPRGFILDRNGETLVKNKIAVQLKINLNYIEDLRGNI